jgi:hypothetical protein
LFLLRIQLEAFQLLLDVFSGVGDALSLDLLLDFFDVLSHFVLVLLVGGTIFLVLFG